MAGGMLGVGDRVRVVVDTESGWKVGDTGRVVEVDRRQIGGAERVVCVCDMDRPRRTRFAVLFPEEMERTP